MNETAEQFTVNQLLDIKLMALQEAEGIIERALRSRRFGDPDEINPMRTGMALDASEIAISASKQIDRHYGRSA
jgi:hypothetical protein